MSKNTLLYPAMLVLLLLLPLLGWTVRQQLRQRVEQLYQLGNARWTQLIIPIQKRRFHRMLAWLAGLGLLILSLARPQWGNEITLVETQGIQLMILLDLSHSMLATDAAGSRLAQAKGIVETAVSTLTPQDEVGLIVFAGEQQILLPLTPIQTQLKHLLANAHPTQLRQQGTLLAPAIETAMRAFPTPRSGQPVILILTDGEDHGMDAVAAARAATAVGIILLPIGLGTEAGAMVPIFNEQIEPIGFKQDELGQPIITRLNVDKLAEVGNGRYLLAQDAFTQLPNMLAEIRQQRTGQTQIVKAIEQYQPFVLVALLLFGFALWPASSAVFLQPTQAMRLLLVLLGLIGWLTGCRQPDSATLLSQGNGSFAQAEYEQALLLYRQAAAAEPETAVPLYNSANTHYRLQQYDKAVTQLEQVEVRGETAVSLSASFNLGNSYFQQEDFTNAIAAYQDILRQFPDDADAKHNLELALEQLNKSSNSALMSIPSPDRYFAQLTNTRINPLANLENRNEGIISLSQTEGKSILSSAVKAAESLFAIKSSSESNSTSMPLQKDW